MMQRSHRLAVRTSDSHSGNTGSIPVGSASSVFDYKKIKDNFNIDNLYFCTIIYYIIQPRIIK